MADAEAPAGVLGQHLLVRLESPGDGGPLEDAAVSELVGQGADAYLVLGGRRYPVTVTEYGQEISLPPGVLSPRREEVARLVCRGLQNKEIAKVMGISVYTVEVHIGAILKELGVANRSGIVAWALAHRAPVPAARTGQGS